MVWIFGCPGVDDLRKETLAMFDLIIILNLGRMVFVAIFSCCHYDEIFKFL